MVNGEPCAPRGACTVLEGVSNAGLPHDLDVDVARLRLMKADHQSQQYRLEDQLLKVFPRQLEQDAQLLEGFAQDRATLAANPEPEAEFGGLTVRGSFIEEKEAAGKAILAACKEAAQVNPVEFGAYRGLTFLFAFVPGAGQMYQGYMKRGLSLITLFFLCIMAGMLLLEQLVLTALIVWMYSFFDTFNLRAQFIAGTAPADDYLVHFNTKDARLTLFFRDSHKLVGWALIALGAMVAYQNIIMRVLGDVMWRWGQNNPFFRAVYLMLDELPEVVVCVALIVCGVWLVRGPKGKKVHRKKAEEPEDEDFREYTAAEADAPEAPEETADFAMPKLSALLGDPVTPEDPEEPEQPENAEGDDGRTE